MDLDAPEAISAGGVLLPATGWVSGRAGKPTSHWWYRVEHPPRKASSKYTTVTQDATCLVELRSTLGQTVVPPSVHDSGECLHWEKFTEPAVVAVAELHAGVRRVAACALLARHWPSVGARQDAYLALVGGLLRLGRDEARVGQFVAALCRATNDEELAKRQQLIASTATKLGEQQRVTGWILSLLPFGVGTLMMLLNPSYMMEMFKPGWTLLLPLTATIMIIFGNITIRWITRIEV